MFSLESVVNKVTSYQSVIEPHGYYQMGTGLKPWSIRYVNVMGNCIDLRGSGWTYYVNGEEVSTGTTPETLAEALK